MADFVGYLSVTETQVAEDAYTSENLFVDRAYKVAAEDLYVDTPSGAGGAFASQPYPDPYSTDVGGAVGRDFGDDWYHRIHVIPSELDLGNLVSTQSRTIEVWNAYFETKAFTSFEIENPQGVEVNETSGVSAPVTLAPLQLLTYEIGVSLNGPPTIDTSLQWTIAGEVYVARVIGRRVVLFPFAPNWNTSVRETLAYRATVFRANDGSEQRASLRGKPRRAYEYTAQLKGRNAQIADSLLFGWQNRMFALPAWPEQTALTAAVSAGDTVLPCVTVYRTFAAGGLVCVYGDSEHSEVREIEAVDGASVTITAPLSSDWPAGTRVYPAFVAALGATVNGVRRSDSLFEVPVRFSCEPYTTHPNLPGASAAQTYQGVELHIEGGNWADGVNVEWSSDYEARDLGTGMVSLFQKAGFSQMSRTHDWTLKNLADVYDFRGWLERREGRAKPVYMPSFFADFTMVSDLAVSDVIVDVEPNGYDTLVDAHPARRDIVFLLRDGTVLTRRIASVSVTDEGNIRLGVDSAIGQTVLRSQVKRLCLLSLYRLAADAVTIDWRTRGVATARTTLVATTTA